MTSLAVQERALLAAEAEALGPDAPTLCGGWTVRDLLTHLVVRERHPAAVGIAVPALAGVLRRTMDRVSSQEFGALVAQVRQGPPRWSPLAVPALGELANTLELFVHHEDLRRAQPGWHPRPFTPAAADRLWDLLRLPARGLLRRVPVGVVAERSDTGVRRTLTGGSPEVLVRGPVPEVVLYVHGRKQQARVELLGDPGAVERLRSTRLGV